MPMGFRRLRILNESGKDLKPTSYAAHADEWGEAGSQIINESNSALIKPATLFGFPIIAGTNGLPGVLSIRAGIQVVGGKKIEKWLLASSWPGYEIQQVDITVDPGAAYATARLFLTEDYYEERIRYFS